MNRFALLVVLAVLVVVSMLAPALRAEIGAQAWLRYTRLDQHASRAYDNLPGVVVTLGESAITHSAQQELLRGMRGMLEKDLRIESKLPDNAAIVLATFSELQRAFPALHPPADLHDDGFWLTQARLHGHACIIVTATNDRGILYGVFALLRKIAQHESVAGLNELQQPYASLRWIDQWDNLDGSIERGYAGRSIFFENGNVRADLSRIADYARLLASVGINGCSINNVNANPRLLQDDALPQLSRVAQAFRPWGVHLSISVDLASPKTIGGLDTFDPADPRVAEWWRKKVDQIYAAIPDFAGFVVKADSEDRPGPSTYHRTQADAANVIGRALKPHHGITFYRAFVYNHHLDWRDPHNDRAKAAYDYFHPLDGKFDDNVIIQIKHGPIDFQAREPVSPLFGGLQNTNQAVELQITQEYTGQQRHLCFLIPMWKEVLDFDIRVNGEHAAVMDLVAGKTFHRPTGGFVGVANVGLDENWLGHPLAMANLYGYARLAWDPRLSAKTIAEEWTTLTLGNDSTVVQKISSMLLSSWKTYESYTGPLGAQTLTDILGSHFGPGIESSEENGWGQWHRADHLGIGMDRSAATGTGFAGQYPPQVAEMYESLASTPDELVLFFHHVPYTYVLHSGKTVIQQIYDSHYEGAERAAAYIQQWQSLKGRVDSQQYDAVLARLEYQSGHAIVWRDAICNWFLKTSGIPDAQGRVGHHPNRIEAEDMQLTGYTPVAVIPWENASGGKAIECNSTQICSSATLFTGPAGQYEIDTQYFDQNSGESKFRLYVRNQIIDQWTADDHLPATKIGGDSSTRHRTFNVTLAPEDEIRIEGTPDRDEHAPLDYLEIVPAKTLTIWTHSARPLRDKFSIAFTLSYLQEQTHTMSAPFRADHIGSFLRPTELLEARRSASPEHLRQIEDQHILRILAKQKELGFAAATDGELRRRNFMSDFTDAVAGFDLADAVGRIWQAGQSAAAPVSSVTGVVSAKLRQLQPLTGHELPFLKAHSPLPIKITLPSATQFPAISFKRGVTDKFYKDHSALLWHIVEIMKADLQKLSADGVAYIQIDAPRYSYYMDPKWRAWFQSELQLDPDSALDEALRADNACFQAARHTGVTLGIHLCRGNNRSHWYAQGGYDAIAEKLFNSLEVDRFLLEYDDERSGTFAPLRFVPRGKTVVLGLVSSKIPRLENPDELAKRIDEASQYVALEDLALSPQCGFASTAEGNLLTEEDQWAKLQLVTETVRRVWG